MTIRSLWKVAPPQWHIPYSTHTHTRPFIHLCVIIVDLYWCYYTIEHLMLDTTSVFVALCNLSFFPLIYNHISGVLTCSLRDHILLVRIDRQMIHFLSYARFHFHQRHSNGQPLWPLIWICFIPPCPQDDAWSKLMKLIFCNWPTIICFCIFDTQ